MTVVRQKDQAAYTHLVSVRVPIFCFTIVAVVRGAITPGRNFLVLRALVARVFLTLRLACACGLFELASVRFFAFVLTTLKLDTLLLLQLRWQDREKKNICASVRVRVRVLVHIVYLVRTDIFVDLVGRHIIVVVVRESELGTRGRTTV